MQVQQANAMLVGDAAGLATRDMGEWIAPAVRSGLLAAQAIGQGEDYKLKSILAYSFTALMGGRG